ncbi:MAG: MFS transporter [Fuerstiella sp.]
MEKSSYRRTGTPSPRFYGWYLLGAAWLIYGFGLAPGYYSWGFFTPEVINDLGLSRTDAGAVFGAFTMVYSCIGPLTGILISRWGVRATIVCGSLISALGFLLLSYADSLIGCFVCYSVMAGTGIGLSTILPCQTLATQWFTRYRARAVAIIFIAGGIVGRIVAEFDAWILQWYSWRGGWQAIAGVSVLLAAVAALFVRNHPSDIGQYPDGLAPDDTPETAASDSAVTVADTWTVGEAILTREFAVLCLSGIAHLVPWCVVVVHGRLHLEDIGFSTSAAASVLGTMVMITIVGRLAGSLGDFILPQKVVGCALLAESLGMLGVMSATELWIAYAATALVALGFGTANTAIAVVMSTFFGREAFARTTGIRLFIMGGVAAVAPPAAGWIYESTGSYQIAFVMIALLAGVVGVATLRLRAPLQNAVTQVP